MNCDTSFVESWSHWDDEFESLDSDSLPQPSSDNNNEEKPTFLFLPHSTASAPIRHVSSCYFSIESSTSERNSADLLSLWEESMENADISRRTGEWRMNGGDGALSSSTEQPDVNIKNADSSPNLLNHDILMHVFTFLDPETLAAFSETARLPNFECFYYLQLQLQRSLLPPPASTSAGSAMHPGIGYLSRLAMLDPAEAEASVQQFLDSNSTLQCCSSIKQPLSSRHQSLSAAALVITTSLYTASAFMTTTHDDASTTDTMVRFMSDNLVIVQNLFKVALMMGSARAMANTMSSDKKTLLLSIRQQQVKMRRILQQLETAHGFSSSLSRIMHAAYCAACGQEDRDGNSNNDEQQQQIPWTPNPYEHLPNHYYCHPHHPNMDCRDATGCDPPVDNSDSAEDATTKAAIAACSQASSNKNNNNNKSIIKMPSGCVGAYGQAIRRASGRLASLVKERRQQTFQALDSERQAQISRTFIDACRSDDSVDVVQNYVLQGFIDVEGFYLGSDGTETCALHAAALFGSCRILDFLCRGLDEIDPALDGGLCDVNCKDSNGWTALHFAAGANSMEAVRILISTGANLSVEAANGYTPLQWAVRLRNGEVAEELRRQAGAEIGWISRQPLSAIASRFFNMVPSH